MKKPSADPILPAHFEVNRLAALLDMSPRFVKDQVKAGNLKGYRLGSKIVVEGDSVQAFLEARRLGPNF